MGVLSGPFLETVVDITGAEGSAAPIRAGCPNSPRMSIAIDPFIRENVGPNSVDVRLGDRLLMYDMSMAPRCPVYGTPYLDTRAENPTSAILLDDAGWILQPGILYLGHTIERTRTSGLVPWLDGRSSVGRLGLFVHVTAGRGDDGFGEIAPDGWASWTLELTCIHPVKVYPGMKIAQITYFELIGERRPYRGRYSRQSDFPIASRIHQFEPARSDTVGGGAAHE